MESVNYHYHFFFQNGREELFDIALDGTTLAPLDPLPPDLPAWTQLEFQQCSNCPLTTADTPHCPLAARLTPLVNKMSDVVSIDDVKVEVTQDERLITRTASAQEGISTLMGIITATSGCPHTVFFKPMARFHLPFANTEETFYRAASMYMLGQYYRWQAGKSVDMELKGMRQFYDQVAEVNMGIANRLRSEKREDGSVNAIVLLDIFVKIMPVLLDDTLTELQPLFKPYIDAEQSL